MRGILARGLEVWLVAHRLKEEQGWPHPLEWDERDFGLIVTGLAAQLGYGSHKAPWKTASEFLAHRLALLGLHRVDRHLDGIPKLSGWKLIPIGGDDELKLAIWRAATAEDDETHELRKAVMPILLRQGRSYDELPTMQPQRLRNKP